MEQLTKEQLKQVLTSRLSLKDPLYLLQKAGGRILGNVVSPSFKGKRDHERQRMIWDVLDSEFGADSVHLVGMLLAYTPEEWNLGLDDTTVPGKVKKVG